MKNLPLVLIVGGGEIGSAVAHRLRRVGLKVIIVEIAKPTCIRRLVCFAEACYRGEIEVEGVRGVRVDSIEKAMSAVQSGHVAVVMDDFRKVVEETKPDVVVDARMLKRRSDMSMSLAGLVIGLGPGFKAGDNAHVVIETNRGHSLGRVIYDGEAEPHTHRPAEVMGLSDGRVIRAPADGRFESIESIGKIVKLDDKIGSIHGVDGMHEVKAPISGLLRGLVASGLMVNRGQKIGDIDPRDGIRPDSISDKGRAVSGGVLEAIVAWWS